VPRSVDQIQVEALPLAVGVGKGHGLALDGDPPLPLDVHRVEDLVAKLPLVDLEGPLDQAVREGRLAVVDVGR